MSTYESVLKQYDYVIPTDLIANMPASPRTSARLLVYDTRQDTLEHRTINDLPTLVAGCHLVFNDTKVLPARVRGYTKDAEDIEILCLVDQGVMGNGKFRALVNRRVKVGDRLHLGKVTFEVLENHEKSMLLSTGMSDSEFQNFLSEYGETPLPPYIKNNSTEVENREYYQTIFADNAPSVAAPTASLHFTDDLVSKLTKNRVSHSQITLQVGLGTFAPIFEDNFVSHKLHSEHYNIPSEVAQDIYMARQDSRPIVAVGTTVVRALESAKNSLAAGKGSYGTTDIFIYHPYQFSYPDVLMTNFHVPRSSLMCLVDAYIKYKGGKRNLVDVYKVAISESYRFYSFGDAMLIL